MISMTGYTKKDFKIQNNYFSVLIKSLNSSKGLDINIKTPRYLILLEPEIRKLVEKELADFLKSDEGQKQIIEALETLQGRTDFKGQSQLKNRVPSEDPMLDPKGNFYHYFWQGGDGRAKPKDWQMPNYQKIIKLIKI